MKPEFENIALTNNEALHRFEILVNSYTAFIEYRETTHKIALLHTEVPGELQGGGAGTAIVEKTLNYIQASGKKLQPFCPFVFAYIKRHPEWKAIVDEQFVSYDKL